MGIRGLRRWRPITKAQTLATCGCLATGQSQWPRAWAAAYRLYAGSVCDNSAAEAAYAAIVALHKCTLHLFLGMGSYLPVSSCRWRTSKAWRLPSDSRTSPLATTDAWRSATWRHTRISTAPIVHTTSHLFGCRRLSSSAVRCDPYACHPTQAKGTMFIVSASLQDWPTRHCQVRLFVIKQQIQGSARKKETDQRW